MENIRRPATVGALVLAIGVAALTTACGAGEKEAPTTTSTTSVSTSAVPASPTEKGSFGGPNSFSPTIKAPPAPTATPGDHY